MASHRHHSSRAAGDRDRDRERIQPLHMPPSQSHPPTHLSSHPQQQQQQAHSHANGIMHHPINHSTHPSPSLSNGHPHSQQMGSSMISPSQSIHPNMTPIMNQVNGHSPAIQKLAKANEETWLLVGEVAEQMNNLDFALTAYEHALRHNSRCVAALSQVAGIARTRENYAKAVDYFTRVVNLPGHETNGEVWSALGHCYLMQDDLQKAYSAYQQALYHLPNPKDDPKLWYGIGILYDRYGSLDHAEEAFSSVLHMEKDFDKTNEILFRLGIIYKQQAKYEASLDCFDRILRSPPSPLAHIDIWFQIGHVYENQKDYIRAKDAYERVVAENPNHSKVLQQLGWLYHQQGAPFQNQELAIQYLTKSLEADASDAQSWYLLGRAYMAGQKYNKAYEAYQQAVYRDGRNPTFWCSIGVLYFQINQYRDALDAYSRAIRINPYISEVWFDLGSLYESCNNQISDAIDAYGRAAELDPFNPHIKQRLDLLKNVQENGGQLPTAPGPQDVHPTAYATGNGPPGIPGSGHQGGPGHPPGGRLLFRSDSRGSNEHASLPAPAPPAAAVHHASPGPFRGGPPPPVILDDSRRPAQHTQLAPMEVDRPPPSGRDQGFSGRSSLLNQVGIVTQLPPTDYGPPRRGSPSISPPHPRTRSPTNGYQRNAPQTSPSGYAHDVRPQSAAQDSYERPYDPRREDRGRDRGRERSGRDAPSRSQVVNAPPLPYDGARSSPRERPSENAKRGSSVERAGMEWDPRRPIGGHLHAQPHSPIDTAMDGPSRRYDPLHHERDKASSKPQNTEGERLGPKFDLTPDSYRSGLKANPFPASLRQASESPRPDQRKKSRQGKEREREGEYSLQEGKKEQRKKPSYAKRPKEESGDTGIPQVVPYPELPPTGPRPEPSSEKGAGRSSPQTGVVQPAARPVDEDYDEGVAETLIGFASQRPSEGSASALTGGQSQPTSRGDVDTVMRSPPASLKRPLSPPMDSLDAKRSRTESGAVSRVSPPPPQGKFSPSRSSRPSPIPFRVQASPEIFRSAEMDKERSSAEGSPRNSPGSPSPPAVGISPRSNRRMSASSNASDHVPLTLPPITTISPRTGSVSPSADMPVHKENKADRKGHSHAEHNSPRASTPVSSSSRRASPPQAVKGGSKSPAAASPPGRSP